MRLKSIKLAGFKSFVDPTKVNLPGNLCAVVGPNGCGKSNIIDAVRWVMGESSAKNLRGENSTDVIFNGSTSRNPVGQSTVELIFDNQDRTLAGEFASYNEVSIRRKVTREGQSTYFLNGQKCRRRDVTDLFLGTGLGPRSYSIIEQGTISRLIESRPEELRVYIEEAAGISRYKERRRDTSNRISRTRENLSRLQDITDELSRQLDTLKQQAESAEKYTQLKQSERQFKSQLATLQWRELSQKLGAQSIIIKNFEEQIILQRSEQDVRFSQIDVQKNDLAVLNENFGQLQGEFYSLGAKIARIEQSIEHNQMQQKRWFEDVSEATLQLGRIDEAYATDNKELEHLTQQSQQLALNVELACEQLLEAEQNLQGSHESHQHGQMLWQEKNEEQGRLKGLIDVAKTGLKLTQQQSEQAHQDHQECLMQLQNLNLPNVEDAKLLSEQIDHQQEQQQNLTEQILSQEGALQLSRQHERDYQQRLDVQVQELGVLAGQISSLQLLMSEAEQEAVLLPAKWQTDECAKLIDTMSVESGWESAVEHVLRDWLGSYLMPQSEHLSQNDLFDVKGLALIVPLGSQSFTKLENAWPILLGKIGKLDAPLELRGLLEHVYLANNELEAKKILSNLPIYCSVILPSGLWLGHGWIRTPPREDSRAGILGRKQQVQTLSVTQKSLRELQQNTQQELALEREEALTLEQSLSEMRQKWRLTQNSLQQQQQKSALLQQQSQQFLMQQKGLQHRVEEQSKRLEQLGKELVLLQEELNERQLMLESLQLDMPGLEIEKESLEVSLGQARLEFSHKQQQVFQIQTKMSSVSAQMHSLGRSTERMQEQRAQWSEKQAQLQASEISAKDTNEGAHESLTGQLDTALTLRVDAEAGMEKRRHEISQLEHLIRQLEQQQLKQEHEIQSTDSRLQEQRLIERELEVNADNIKQAMLAENVRVEKFAQTLPDQVNAQELSYLLEQCQNRIKRLGAINLVAIEEYKTQQERKVFLDQQHDELIEALESLEQAIAKIDKETKARFKKTFDTVNEHLNNLFPKVFGGGRASLELTDDDMLATGVTIMAQPPGKRNSSIHLLSGGEKALTAIALVFSIFQLNPSPFCMLDEVDAPLDDANVERYAKLVKEMSSQVQFIYISHNKIAMEMATQLLGVTMQEAGVSRLVTVDIAQAINMTEQSLVV